tara:strand:+ start:1676 stop:2404 length:729 start_codon:yes stop_codon:yes gene_type:complete
MLILNKGKVKTVLEYTKDQVFIRFEDDVTAFEGAKKESMKDKGSINCKISTIIFKRLGESGIKNHWIDTNGLATMRCHKLDIVPLEVVVRNKAAGSICRQTTIKKGTEFNEPLVEFHLKDDSKGDPLLTPDRMKLMGYDPYTFISITNKVNIELIRLFNLINLDLVDFKIEFGYDKNGELVLADEISPDSMRLWKAGTQESFDKDIFREDKGDLLAAYRTILKDLERLDYLPYLDSEKNKKE